MILVWFPSPEGRGGGKASRGAGLEAEMGREKSGGGVAGGEGKAVRGAEGSFREMGRWFGEYEKESRAEGWTSVERVD